MKKSILVKTFRTYKLISKFFNVFMNNGIKAVTSLLILIIATRFLTIESYASYRKFFLIADLLIPIVSFGFSQSVFYYFKREINKKKLLTYIGIFTFLASFFLIFLLYLYSVYFNLKLYEFLDNLILELALVVLFNSLYPIIVSFLTDNNKINVFARWNFIYQLLLLVAVLFVSNEFNDFIYIVYARLVFSFITILTGFYLAYDTNQSDKNRNDYFAFKTVLLFSAPICLGSIVGIVNQNIDKILISILEEDLVFVLYSNGAIEIPILGLITGAVSVAVFGELSEKCKNKDYLYVRNMINRLTAINSTLLLPIFIFFMYEAVNFMVILFGETYSDSANIFRVYLLLIPLKIILYGPILISLGFGGKLFRRSLMEVSFNLVLSIIMYYQFGIYGVAFSTIIVNLFWTVPYNLKLICGELNCKISDLLSLREIINKLLISSLLMLFLQLINYVVLNLYFNFTLKLLVFNFIIFFLFYRLGFLDKKLIKGLT